MADNSFEQTSAGAGQYPPESPLTVAYGDPTNVTGTEIPGVEGNVNSYEQSSYASSFNANAGGLYTSPSSGFNANAGGLYTSPSSGFDVSSVGLTGFQSSSTFETGVQQTIPVDPNNPQNLYQDPNPQIIRRPAQSGQLTYTQNVKVRFLQPPPVPPPGPIIIKEVRPPQPPPPPPLRIRQQAPAIPPPPPLVLRERPPVPPAVVASQTVIRPLPAIPLPPRSVIIERLPPLPPKPRDIIIERWVPYGPQAKRKTIVQRAAAAKPYPKPRNIIIQYEPIKVRVIRQFQRLGITQENPQIYVQRYGVSLLDAQTLVQQARAAGVVEDISPPATAVVSGSSSQTFNESFRLQATGGDSGVSVSASSFEPTTYGVDSTSEISQGVGVGVGGDFSSTYEQSSTGYENYNPLETDNNNSNTDPADAAFVAADLNKDGSLDPEEFRQFLNSQLRYQQ